MIGRTLTIRKWRQLIEERLNGQTRPIISHASVGHFFFVMVNGWLGLLTKTNNVLCIDWVDILDKCHVYSIILFKSITYSFMFDSTIYSRII